jgi:hypothetical protein
VTRQAVNGPPVLLKTRQRLSELHGMDSLIFLLSRGSYWPKDHQQHLELALNYPKILATD